MIMHKKCMFLLLLMGILIFALPTYSMHSDLNTEEQRGTGLMVGDARVRELAEGGDATLCTGCFCHGHQLENQVKDSEDNRARELLLQACNRGDLSVMEKLLKTKMPQQALNEICHIVAYKYSGHISSKVMQLLLDYRVDANNTGGAVRDRTNLLLGGLYPGKNNYLQVLLSQYTFKQKHCSYMELHSVDLEEVVCALVRAGLRVDYVNGMNLSVLDFAADIGTAIYSVNTDSMPINYKRYFKIKAIMIETLNSMQEVRFLLPDLLVATAQLPTPLADIVCEYCHPDRSAELRYVAEYRIHGESEKVVSRSRKQVKKKKKCVIA